MTQKKLSTSAETSSSEAVPEDKVKCIITGKLRDRNPEEKTRQTVARSLIEVYDYDSSDMDAEVPIKMGRSTKRADIVIYKKGSTHDPSNIHLIVEVKEEEVEPDDEDSGLEQLESYVAASPNCEYALWVGSQRMAFNVKEEKGERKLEEIPDIPKQGASGLPRPDHADLTTAVNLKNIFTRIHNYVYANQGLQKDKAFEEIQKLIFIKVYDENYSDPLQFYVTTDEDTLELRSRLEDLFDKVKSDYEYIFDEHAKIELNDRVLRYVVSELQRFSIINTPTDVKGEAYEELVGPNLRGDRGEFFTPRNVCDMATRMAFTLLDDSDVTNPGALKIIDPAVGTGGFLISALQIIDEKFKNRGLDESERRSRVKQVAENNLYGIDFNPFLVKVAQMNNVMHGDGSANVVQADSLNKPSSWNREARSTVKMGDFDVVITNPPFGTQAVVDDPDILEQYELSEYEAASTRDSLPPEQLFIERGLDLLKPGGVMAIVLPDSILSNPGLEWIRTWMLQEAQILASIDLPVETFQPSTGTQTSVLLLRKKTPTDQNKEYSVFMSMPESVGEDRRGNPVYERAPDGDIMVDEEGREIIDDDLPNVVESFEKWVAERGMI